MTIFAGGFDVFETPFAVERTRVKVYPKRKAKNAAHLHRMNAKWKKRYGFAERPAMYLVNKDALGRQGQVLMCHPALMSKVRAMLAEVRA